MMQDNKPIYNPSLKLVLFKNQIDKMVNEGLAKDNISLTVTTKKTKIMKPEITYDEFQKLDLRIGRVTSAESIPKSDKLLKLQVSFGEFKRQIVAGIGKQYAPEYLFGKQMLFVINLQPRKLMGVESHGMVLATESVSCEEHDKGFLAFLTPSDYNCEGSKVE